MKSIIGLKFEVCWCEACDCMYVKCPACGNNSCNGGYGPDGEGTCEICPITYEFAKAIPNKYKFSTIKRVD